MSPAPNHEKYAEMAPAFVVGALSAADSAAFRAHMHECLECAAAIGTLQPVADCLARTVPIREPSPDLRTRVLAGVGVVLPEQAPEQLSGRRGGPRTTMVAPWLAAAAALILAAGAAFYAFELRGRVDALEAGLRQAAERAATAERQIVGLQQTAAEAQSTVGILVAPDLARIELRGEVAAPTARASAFWSRSRGLVLTASDLPQPPPGRTYQLWVVTSQSPVSAGLLEPDSSGSVFAVIRTPSDIPTPVAMAVTLEPAGGVPAPTGERYLLGTPPTAL